MRTRAIMALALCAVLAGCAPAPTTLGGGATVSPIPTSSTAPTSPQASLATDTAPAGAPVVVRVYLAHSQGMQPVLRTAPAGTKAVLNAALTALLAGPEASESAAGLRTLVPAGTKLRSVSISDGIATVDLDKGFAAGGGTLSMTDRLAQLVYTATQFPGVKGVRLDLDGRPVTVFGGEGIVLDHPQTRADFESATPAIFVDEPAWMGTVRSGTTAFGTADVFEAMFRLQVRDHSGALVFDKTVHAASGTGTRGAWSTMLSWKAAQPGIGQLKVFATSAKDGKPVDVLTVPVRIKG